MPKPFEGYPAFVSGYYSDVISDYIDLDVSESLISGTIATGLKDHESLDMTLTLDKSYFSGAYTALSAAQRTHPHLDADAPAGRGAAVRYAVSGRRRADPVQHAGLPLGEPRVSDDLLREKRPRRAAPPRGHGQ